MFSGRARTWAPLLLLGILACGGNVVVDGSVATSSGAGASGSVTTATASTGGMTSTTSSGVEAGGGQPCTDSFADLVVDDGPSQHLVSDCADLDGASDSPGPAVAYVLPGNGDTGLTIIACVSNAEPDEGVSLGLDQLHGPGEYTHQDYSAAAEYEDHSTDTIWDTHHQDATCEITLTALGAVGEAVEGTFSATVAQKYGPAHPQHTIKGSFHVCRVADGGPP